MAYKVTLVTTVLFEDEEGEPSAVPEPFRWSKEITSLSTKHDIQTTASSSTVVVWDPTAWTGFVPASFDVFFVVVDNDCEIELTTNEGDANEELNSFALKADVPFVLGDDASYYNHSASNAWGGTVDVIDKIRIRETAGNTAVIRGWILLT